MNILKDHKKILIIVTSIFLFVLACVSTIMVLNNQITKKASQSITDQKRVEKTNKIHELRDKIRIEMRSQDPSMQQQLDKDEQTLDELLRSD